MEKDQRIKYRYGLVGKDISYSFSEQYFFEKFKALKLEGVSYQNFDLPSIQSFTDLIARTKNLSGLNVTIPYKQEVIPYLDELDIEAKEIGAVNTIKFLKNNRLKGFNTDAYGFQKSISPLLKEHHKKALVLGTGGASKAVKYVLNKLGIEVLFVSRNPNDEASIAYKDLSKAILKSHSIIVNCTPLGTFPIVDECPDLPYQYITEQHILFDLIYNPSITLFLKKGAQRNAQVCNGLSMLELQAEKSWEIWNG